MFKDNAHLFNGTAKFKEHVYHPIYGECIIDKDKRGFFARPLHDLRFYAVSTFECFKEKNNGRQN